MLAAEFDSCWFEALLRRWELLRYSMFIYHFNFTFEVTYLEFRLWLVCDC